MMKTHEFARALELLARMLKSGQNVELKDWSGPAKVANNGSDAITASDAALALNVLVGLSRYNKGQWRALIEDWGIPVPILPADSVRDLIGRLFNYFGENPDMAKRITAESTKKGTKASPELMRVLSILLGENKEGEGSQSKAEEKGKREGKQ